MKNPFPLSQMALTEGILVPHLVPFIPTINNQHKPATSRMNGKLPASTKNFRVLYRPNLGRKKNGGGEGGKTSLNKA